MTLAPLQSSLIAEATSGTAIRHGFFTREGGVSTGIYAGLNVGLGSGDDRSHVVENRTRVAGWFGLAEPSLMTVSQVHSPDVVVVTQADPFADGRPEADGMVTAVPNLALGVLAADCGPVLFADAQAGIIGACHAGWGGAVKGVLEATISAMESLGADRQNTVACLGPSISQENYEVGPEFVERLVAINKENNRYFAPSVDERPSHRIFDLKAYSIDRLTTAGVRAQSLGDCTYPDEARFFSYRRTTHRGEPDYGRQISAIAILD